MTASYVVILPVDEYEALKGQTTVSTLLAKSYNYGIGCPIDKAADEFRRCFQPDRREENGHLSYCLASALRVWLKEDQR